MLSIIIVTYNSEKFIQSCLDFLFRSDYFDNDVIIIDNASEDKTMEVIQQSYPNINFLKNDTNKGFAKACNQAADRARGDYLLFLNPDTKIIHGDFFRKLLKPMEDIKEAASIGPRFLNPDNTLQPSAGRFPSIRRIIIDRIKLLNTIFDGIIIRRNNFYNTTQEVDWLCGGCILVRRSVFKKLGGFSEDFFMYGEDTDLCYRIKERGYKNYLFADTEIIHEDLGKKDLMRRPQKYFYIRRGFLLFFRKYNSVWGYYFLLYLIRLEALIGLTTSTLKKPGGRDVHTLWRKYLLATLKLKS